MMAAEGEREDCQESEIGSAGKVWTALVCVHT